VVSIGSGATFNFGNNSAAVVKGIQDYSGGGGTVTSTNTRALTVNGSGTYSFSGNVTGATAEFKVGLGGSGKQILSGSNSYGGLTTITTGILNIRNDNALGTTNSGIIVASGSTLQLEGGINVGNEAMTFNGTGAALQNGVLVNVSGANSYGGQLTMGSSVTTAISSDSGTLNLTNTGAIVNANNRTLLLTGSGNGSLAGALAGAGNIAKNGMGTWTLTGANTYSSATAISAGSLQLGNGGSTGSLAANSTITGSGNLTINRNNAVVQGTDFSSTALTGATSFTQAGTGTTTLNRANTHTGGTTITGGGLKQVIANTLGHSTLNVVTINGGALDVNGLAAAAGALAGTGGIITNSSGTKSTITLGNLSSTYSGNIVSSAGLIDMIKNLSGTQTFSSTNINLSTLQIQAGIVTNTGTMNLAALTMDTGTTTGRYVNAGTGTLNISGIAGLGGTSAAKTNIFENMVGGVVNITNNQLQIGNGLAALNLVTNSGTFSNKFAISIGQNASATGINQLALGAGTLTTTERIFVGNAAGLSGTNILSVDSGATLTNGQSGDRRLIMGFAGSQYNVFTNNGNSTMLGAEMGVGSSNNANTMEIQGGNATFTTVTMGSTNVAAVNNTNTINLSGGILSVTQFLAGSQSSGRSTNLINFNGGTLRAASNANATFLGSGIARVTLNSGGGTIDSSTNAISIASAIEGVGALRKAGSGTLTLSSANTYTGGTVITEGGLTLGNANALGAATNALTINDGILNLSGNSVSLGSLAGTGGTVSNSISGTATITAGGNNASTTYSGAIRNGTGTIALTKNGTGITTLTGANTYSGTTTISAGSLQLGNGGSAGSLAANSTIANNGNLTINRNNAVVQGADFSSAAITGTGSFTQAGTGTTTLNAANTYTGATAINGGQLIINGTNTASAVAVNNTGTLGGSGSVGAVTVANGGTINPGNSPGTLTVASSIWNDGGNYNWQLYNATGAAGVGYDTISSTGELNLTSLIAGGFNINLWTIDSLSSTSGSATNFNDNGSYNWILGTFGTITGFNADRFNINTSAANGAGGFINSFMTGGFKISTNGSGQLLLTYQGASPVWTGGSGNLSTIGTTNGSALVFTGPGGNVTNNQVSSLSSMTFSNGAGAITFSGNAVTNGSGGIVNNSAVTQTVSLALSLGTNQSFNAASGNLAISGNVTNNGNTLTLAGASDTTVIGNITGTGGLTKVDGGTATLSGNNTYSGTTTVNGGTLTANNYTALGSGANLIVNSNSTVALGSYNATVGAVNLNSGNISGSGTLTGTSYNVSSGTIAPTLAGAGVTLTKTGAGTVTLNAAQSYTGKTTVSGGTLALGVGASLASTNINLGTLAGQGTLDVTALGTSGITIGVGQTLAGYGTVKGNTTIASGGTLAPGTSPGILTFTEDLILSEGSTSIFEVAGLGGAGASNGFDQALVSGDLTYGGHLRININGSYNEAGAFGGNIFQFGLGRNTGNFTSVKYSFDGTSYYDLTYYNASNTWQVWDDAFLTQGDNGYIGFNMNTGYLTVVPEPASWALFVGGVSTVLIFRRRRNS
jgi:autotransporter-associated beta strand protein